MLFMLTNMFNRTELLTVVLIFNGFHSEIPGINIHQLEIFFKRFLSKCVFKKYTSSVKEWFKSYFV